MTIVPYAVPKEWLHEIAPVAAHTKARFRLRPMSYRKPVNACTARRDQQTISTRLQGPREQFSAALANHRAWLHVAGMLSGTLFWGALVRGVLSATASPLRAVPGCCSMLMVTRRYL